MANWGRVARLGWRARSEITNLWWLRRQVLRAELVLRAVPHTCAGDAVVVYDRGLWFDIYAHTRDGRALPWVIDHPHADLAEAYPGLDIGWVNGFRFPLDQLPELWRRYQNAS
ncbi:hypothetical protein ACFQZZ_14540 [Nocardia sp. GCM10030253]|uniref:hypothetical protein n=1 Tax=Nocardia sp. GCM10030253 TaxID=3273404 RepID=UPI00363AF81F